MSYKETILLCIIIMAVVFVISSVASLVILIVKIKTINGTVKVLFGNIGITPREFFEIRNSGSGSNQHDFAGVYILHNSTKDMDYVGQSMDVFQKVNNHFTGHGNGGILQVWG